MRLPRASSRWALLAALLALPWLVPGDYEKHILIMGGIFVVLVSSLNLLVGFFGELSLGHHAFFGLGAYTSALLALRLGLPFWLDLVMAGVVAAAFGLGIGYVTLRLRGPYFVIVTLAFAEILRLVVHNWIGLTNGPMGLKGIPPPDVGLPGLFSVRILTKDAYYYVILGLVLVTVLVISRLVDSGVGRAFKAVRENEGLAASVGVDAFAFGLLAFGVSTFFAGLAGSFWAHYVLFVSPDLLGFSFTISMLLMLIIGGRGTMAGPILGAVIFTIVPEYLRVAEIYRLSIFGLLLVVATLFIPRGLASLFGAPRRPA